MEMSLLSARLGMLRNFYILQTRLPRLSLSSLAVAKIGHSNTERSTFGPWGEETERRSVRAS